MSLNKHEWQGLNMNCKTLPSHKALILVNGMGINENVDEGAGVLKAVFSFSIHALPTYVNSSSITTSWDRLCLFILDKREKNSLCNNL